VATGKGRSGRTPLPGTPSGIRAASGDGATDAGSASPAADLDDVPGAEEMLDAGRGSGARPTWMVPLLASVASLAVGMVLGALMFRNKAEPPPAASSALVCPEPAAPAAAVIPPVPEAAADAAAAVAELEADAAAAAAPPEPGEPAAPAGISLGGGACRMRVESLPKGAVIVVDGRDLGAAPLDLIDAACDAKIVVEAQFDRFDPWRREVTLTADKPGKVVASLRRPRVELTVTSTPSGALVTIAGKPAGKTPLKVQVPAYVKTSVKIGMTGFKDHDVAVAPKAIKPQQVTATLEKLPRGPGGKLKPGGTTPVKPGATTPVKPGATKPGTKPATTAPAKPGAKPAPAKK
jgi:hypothetical protein